MEILDATLAHMEQSYIYDDRLTIGAKADIQSMVTYIRELKRENQELKDHINANG